MSEDFGFTRDRKEARAVRGYLSPLPRSVMRPGEYQMLDRLAAGHHEGVAAKPLIVGDPYFYAGQVPLVVSEWGGFGFPDYGGPGEPGAKAERIRAFKRELRLRPIAGDVYTQAVSIEEEVNGLIDPQTGELLVPLGLLGPEQS